MTRLGLAAVLLLAQAAPGADVPAPDAVAPAPAASVQPLGPAGPVLTLAAALAQARGQNPDLKVWRERLEQSKELHRKAWAGYLPQVTASGNYTHNSFSDVSVPSEVFGAPAGAPPILLSKQELVTAQLQAVQPLVAPRAFLDVAVARASERLGEANTEAARRDVLFGVARAYYSAAGAKQLTSVQERQLAIALQHERDARVRHEAGTAPRITLLRAEIDRARAEQDLRRAQATYTSARVSLARLLARDDAAFEVDVPPTPKLPPGDDAALVATALHDRPDVRAADEALAVAERSRDADRARYLPQLSAFGRVSYSNAAGFSGDDTTWALGLQLDWTLLDGLLRESDLRTDASRIREAQASREGVVNQARDEVVRAGLDHGAALANRAKAEEERSLARENQRLVDVNYRAGAATYLEVTDANTALLQSELTLVAESLAADLAALNVLQAIGAFASGAAQ